MTHDRIAMFNNNKLKLGTFGTNGRGASHTTAPDRYTPTWKNALNAAVAADAAGLEAQLAFARWKGVNDGTLNHPTGVILDPFTWAAGVGQATNYSTLLVTTHAPTVHPIVVAKQAATIDLITDGRLGLNLVGGWNKPEFDMFGEGLVDHDTRYDYLEEWFNIIQKLWTYEEEFDFKGQFLTLKGAMSRPQPVQRPQPVIMNAANSGRGRQFACAYADFCFTTVNPDRVAAKREIAEYKRIAREEFGREIQIWSIGLVTQRATRAEAEEYFNYVTVEHEDTLSVSTWLERISAEAKGLDGKTPFDESSRRLFAAGGMPITGTAQDVADGLEEFSEIGVDGLLLAWNNFDDGIRRLQEDVLPILEQRGLREPFVAPALKTTTISPADA